MSLNQTVRVAQQEALGAGYFLLTLEAQAVASRAEAGQFVMLGLPDLGAMLIRRPFSVARVHPAPGRDAHSFDVLYKVFGNGTRSLSRLVAGDRAALLGPLGRGFQLPSEPTELILLAGGIGNAIFPLLLQQLGERARSAHMIFGARSRSDLTLLAWLQERCPVEITTEDGSLGETGRVTAPLQRRLDTPSTVPRLVLACGPHPMLRAVAQLCEARAVPCQVAMEETMACGFGVCLGCVVPTRNPRDEFERFVRVCCEGPVFDSREIVL